MSPYCVDVTCSCNLIRIAKHGCQSNETMYVGLRMYTFVFGSGFYVYDSDKLLFYN